MAEVVKIKDKGPIIADKDAQVVNRGGMGTKDPCSPHQ